jgi:hypothetical protein
MIKFIKTGAEQMGVELFVLAGYRNEDGVLMKARYDVICGSCEILPMILNRFETKHAGDEPKFSKNFKTHGREVWDKWDEYLHEKFDGECRFFVSVIRYNDNHLFPTAEQEEGDDDNAPSLPVDKSVPWPLESDEDGWPLLPSLKELSLVQIKDIARSFLTIIYSEFRIFKT